MEAFLRCDARLVKAGQPLTMQEEAISDSHCIWQVLNEDETVGKRKSPAGQKPRKRSKALKRDY